MGNSYMPGKKVEQVGLAQRVVDVVLPETSGYNVPAALGATFSAINTALQEAWLLSSNPATRTKGTVEATDGWLRRMKSTLKQIVSIVQGMPGVTPQMLIDAGFTVRKTNKTPKPRPSQKPFIKKMKVDGRTGYFQLRQDVSTRGKPAGVSGATVLMCKPGPNGAPSRDWKFVTNTTVTSAEITFPESETSDVYYITAFWTNSRDESGPAADPLWVSLPAGTVVATDSKSAMTLKAA
ncbi:MAG TPA: hypothetical protein VGN72_22345 [Tepidisphaeraceae bacterium]|jgi:hypothetical protein|nr:hypothetical protein [Tepidisphaeraceae bacterium]